MVEWAICYPADDLQRLFNNGHAQVISVVDESGDVFSRHLGQLFLEDILQTGQNYHILLGVVVVDHSELDDAFPLFENCGLFLVLDVFVVAGGYGGDGCVNYGRSSILLGGCGRCRTCARSLGRTAVAGGRTRGVKRQALGEGGVGKRFSRDCHLSGGS